MKYISPENWQPSEGIELEHDANLVVLSDENILVEAGPGAGKTELLAQKAGFLFQTNQCPYPQKILAISFKKDAAENLRERVLQRCGKEIQYRFSSMTFDAFAKGIVDRFSYALPEEWRPATGYDVTTDNKILDQAFRKFGEGIYDSREWKGSNSKLEDFSKPFTRDVWKLLLKGFDGYPASMTFPMISILANWIIIKYSQIKKALQYTYSHVFLDEFQDTTRLQYQLIKTSFLGSKTKITVVGDEKQRIMGWAGAMNDAFERFAQDFGSTKCSLRMNHRSAPRLVDLQRRMYASLNQQEQSIQPSSRWQPDDGKVQLYIMENEWMEAEKIVADIQTHINAGIPCSDICILCKQKTKDYTNIIISKLQEMGCRARLEDVFQDMLKEPLVKLLVNVLSLATEVKDADTWNFVDEQILNIFSIDTSQSQSITRYWKLRDALNQKLKEFQEHLSTLRSKEELTEIVGEILSFFGEERIHASFPQYTQESYFTAKIKTFLELFYREGEMIDFAWGKAIENFFGKNSIPIMTIHKSKGLEYSVVYFIGLEDGAFWNFRKQPEENRCAFFVALSRAKKQVSFTFCKHRSGSTKPQKHNEINEFYELLTQRGMAEIIGGNH